MLKITVEDFIEEIQQEIIGYEELGEEKAKNWVEKFLNILKSKKLKIIKEEQDKKYIYLKDETELFAYVDNYLVALNYNEEEKYWNGIKNS